MSEEGDGNWWLRKQDIEPLQRYLEWYGKLSEEDKRRADREELLMVVADCTAA